MDELSYVVGGSSAYFSKYGARRRSLLSKRGEFPTGLKKRVYKFLSDRKIPNVTRLDYERTITAKLKIQSNWNGFVPYEAQIEAVSKAIAYGRGTIAMPTGTGKSMVIAMIINELKVKTLIIVPSLEIKKQLVHTLSKIFTDMSWITVENIDSKALKKLGDYDCLIIDEAHHTAAKTYRDLNKRCWNNIYYRFFLTATPFRNDKEEQLLFESIAGQIIYNLSYRDAIKKGYIVPVEAYYIDLPSKDNDCFSYREVYDTLVINNIYRNEVIARLLRAEAPVLCLVREVAHGNILSEMTTIPFVCGTDEDSRGYIELFNRGEILPLIGTTGILGEGVDTKPAEVVIIAGLGKAKSQFMQQIGRAVRKYPGKESAKIIIFKDKSHKFLLRHFKEQVKVLKEEYGVEPIKLEL